MWPDRAARGWPPLSIKILPLAFLVIKSLNTDQRCARLEFATASRICRMLPRAMPSSIAICAWIAHRFACQGVSKPLAVRACLTEGEVRNAIKSFAASTCVLPALIPATYTE
jgi:hypothetical protein